MRTVFFLLFSLYFLLQTTNSAAQEQTIVGTIEDESTKQGLGYVNIGWLDRPIGTVSSENGQFSLVVPEDMPDSAILRFSMIGYQAKEFFWRELQGQGTLSVSLRATVAEIEEITVVDCPINGRQQKGNYIKRLPSAWMGFASEELGTEVATRIRLKKRRKSHIKELQFWIDNRSGDSLFFRLNIYAVEEGRPGKNLLEENIFLEFSTQEDLVVIDLEPYRLVYDQDVFVALEYVRPSGLEKDKGIYFGSNLFGKNSYVRYVSQAKWVKTPILNLGFWLEVCEHK
ncbi:MAG: carboxypeptidase-like regulatory domain-containing protein [Aureispira sp.]